MNKVIIGSLIVGAAASIYINSLVFPRLYTVSYYWPIGSVINQYIHDGILGICGIVAFGMLVMVITQFVKSTK